MKSTVKLPADYKPYESLDICSNKLINGRVPFDVNGNIPFLVGSGEKVSVWLQIPKNKKLDDWQYVVRANRSLHNEIDVDHRDKNEVKVFVKGKLVLHVKQLSSQIAEVRKLDLRPIGLVIYGTDSELHVGNNVMKNNIFENVDAMIGISPENNLL